MRVERNVTGKIKVEDDLKHAGGREMGKNEGAEFIAQKVGRRRFLSARGINSRSKSGG